MGTHALTGVLAAAKVAGMSLRVEAGDVKIASDSQPSGDLVADLKRYRDDINILCRVAAEQHVSLLWCAEQLAPDDHPAELGYPCILKFIELCIERDRPLPGELKESAA